MIRAALFTEIGRLFPFYLVEESEIGPGDMLHLLAKGARAFELSGVGTKEHFDSGMASAMERKLSWTKESGDAPGDVLGIRSS